MANEQSNELHGEKDDGRGSSSVAVKLNLGNDIEEETTTAWLRRSFGPIGAYGGIKKEFFITAVREIEGFPEKLFNIFDTKKQGRLSIQELAGGFGLLTQTPKGKNRKILSWFTQYFEDNFPEESAIGFQEFSKALDDDEFVNNLFKVFDLDGDGEIKMKDLIASLDRLNCASVDSKWYTWIQDSFDVDSSYDRQVTYEQFIKALKLKESFFAQRLFAIFDADGNGTIDMKELVSGVKILTKGTEREKLKFLFEVYDIDGNGELNMEEIKIVLKSCVEESKIKFDDQQINELAEIFFEEADADNDGMISYEEMEQFLTKYPGVAENLTITAGYWLNPPTKKSEKYLRNPKIRVLQPKYIKKNPEKVFFVLLYFLINVALFIWVGIERKDEGGWVILARINGMCLNFNGVFILVLMMKGFLTWLRSTRFGKYFPIDKHIEYHKAVAVVIFIQSVLHFVGHLGRYIVTESKYEVWEYLFTTRTNEGWVGSAAGITGLLLFVIFGIMALMSLPFIRRNGYFELFYFTHHLYVIWWTLLILHAPNFWKWFIGPASFYLVERILRLRLVNKARYGKTYIEEGIILPSKVTHLIIPRPSNFNYKPGDYVLINIPKIAKYEWHPFTISSSPELTETMWLHVRNVGTWTGKLYNYYQKATRLEGSFRRRTKSMRDLIFDERRPSHILYRNTSKELLNGNEHNTNGDTARGIRNGGFKSDANNAGMHGNTIVLNNIETDQKNKKPSDGKLEVYVDGPYGAPSVHFSEAEHAVLISSGIGVTPFASILQTIMLRYKSASHTCPNCQHSWAGSIPYSLKKLRKVDFFWINRDQASFEWFLSLLSQLELEQSEQRGVFSEHFLDMHIYMTSALGKEDMKALGLQLALELIHEKKDKDLITGLRTRTKPGRPNWDKVFSDLKAKNYGKISVFYCGNPALGNILKVLCQKYKFTFRKENF